MTYGLSSYGLYSYGLCVPPDDLDRRVTGICAPVLVGCAIHVEPELLRRAAEFDSAHLPRQVLEHRLETLELQIVLREPERCRQKETPMHGRRTWDVWQLVCIAW